MQNECIDPLIERALGHDWRKLAQDPFDLELGGLLEQGLHVVEVPEDGAGRDPCALGHLFGRGTQQSPVLEAVEHGLGNRGPGAMRAGLSPRPLLSVSESE